MARQMEQVSHYSQSRGQQKKNKVNTNVEWGKHETIHNTREKWMRPFLVFSLFSISLSLSLSLAHLSYHALAIALFPVDRKQIEGNAAI